MTKIIQTGNKSSEIKILLQEAPLIMSGIEKTEEGLEHLPLAGGTETILLVEDDEETRNVTKIILESVGYNVIEAANGEEAIEKFMDNIDSIELLLLDVIMPKKSGKAVCDEIKKIRPDIKALFTSGYTADIIDSKGLLKEGLEFIPKPAQPRILLERIRKILDERG